MMATRTTLTAHALRLVAALMLPLIAAGCASMERSTAVPTGETMRATVLGLPNARFYPYADTKAMAAEGMQAVQREIAYRRSAGLGGPLPTANFLALSGGGDDGAFGAGLLVGWTKRGTRPEFKLVTGISTGALIAPFAFLGPDYDDALTDVYTNVDQKDIFTKRSVLAALTDDALADTAPLYKTISRHLDERMMKRIAQEYGKGRLLLIATTNLDAGRPVIWNIGAIARTGKPEALELIKRVLLASASIPAAFPPVMFDVSVDGHPYQEMHVDGGAVAQSFLYPPTLRLSTGLQRRRVAYIIRNGRLWAPWKSVERNTLTIAGRAVATLIASNGVGDLYRIYATTRRDKVDFNLAYIDSDFTEPYKEPFDRAYMGKLYDYGRRLAERGYPWKKGPPGFTSEASISLAPPGTHMAAAAQ
jgi:hypothetical protein